ncbi:hypothetical protein HDE_06727 [Halotydeus destructor]|nr:hypothetical protein HDE_06727 [Halotydeus destructor]
MSSEAVSVFQDANYYSPINKMLSVAGLGADSQSQGTKYFNIVMLVLSVGCSFFHSISGFITYVGYPMYGLIVVSSIGLTNLVSMTAIKFNYSILAKSLELCNGGLSVYQKGRLNVFSYIVVMLLMIDSVLRFTARAQVFVQFFTGQQLLIQMLLITQCLSDYISSLMFVMLMYFCYIYGELMIANVRNASKSNLTIAQLEIALHRLKSLISNFNDKMSGIALTKFAYTFLDILAFFVDYHFSSQKSQEVFMVLEIYEIVFNLACLLILGVIIDNQNRNILSEYQIQYEMILRREGLSAKAEYVHSRKERYELMFSACGMFDLNKSCLLSYTSAMITFTILFMQLNRVM